MSRLAASKTGGADKTKPPASQTPVIAHEIVPGKFNDNDWNTMVERDTADEFIHDIMDELMDTAMDAIYQKYIEHQLLPFTITQAREAMVEIIEWRFLASDEGEKVIETDLGWTEDEEPEPAVTDCWAQGSVPKSVIRSPTPLEEIPEEEEGEKQDVEVDVQTTEEVQEPQELADVVSDTEEAPQEMAAAEAVAEKPSNEEVKASSTKSSKTKFRPYRGKIKSAGVSKMTESLEESEMKMIYNEIAASMPPSDEKAGTLLNMPASCTSILKVQTGRPPGNKDVVYDNFGNVIAVMRLDPEKLPSHKISVKYHVVDPAVEAAQARLDAMRKGKSTGSKKKLRSTTKAVSSESLATTQVPKSRPSAPSSTVAPLPPPLKSEKPSKVSEKKSEKPSKVSVGPSKKSVERVTKDQVDSPSTEEVQVDRIGSPVTAIEEMEVSHGVIVREGGRVKKGPGRYYGKFDILEESQMGMHPISLHFTNPDITVDDLLDRHTPILRPLGESAPLPPIVPRPPPNQSQQV